MTKKSPRQHLAEIHMAGMRIGPTMAQVMEWLLKFSQIALPELNDNEWTNLIYEIECFVEYGGHHASTEQLVSLCPMRNWSGRQFCPTNILQGDPSPATIRDAFQICQDGFHARQCSLPSRKRIEDLQTKTRNVLEGLINKRITILRIPGSITLFGPLLGPASTPETAYSAKLVNSPQDLFFLHFSDILNLFPLHIRCCSECTTFFLVERRNKRFCSTTCQTRVATRRLRNTPPDRIGKRGRPPKETVVPKNERKNKPKMKGDSHGDQRTRHRSA